MDVSKAIETASRIVSNNANTNFGFFGLTNETHHANAPCHGGAQRKPSVDEVAYYYTSVPNYSSFGDVENRAFIDFITSSEGPWRQFFKDRFSTTLESKDGKACGYFVEIKPEDDRTVLCSMSIATRFPLEARQNYPVFFKLLEEGLDREESFYLSHFFSEYGKRISSSGFCGHTHSFLGNYKFNIKHFEEGTPKPSKFKVGASESGVAGIQARWTDFPHKKRSHVKGILEDAKPNMSSLKGRWIETLATIDLPDIVSIWKEKSRSELLSIC